MLLLRRASRAAWFLPAAFLALAAACSGGDGPTAAETATGNVALEVSGFPAGTSSAGLATFRLTRGDKEFLLGASGVTAGVPAGTWTFTAPNVTVGGIEYRPEPATQTIVVSKSGSSSAQVTYVVVTGSLLVSVVGLPANVDARITLTGPAGFSRAVGSTGMISALTPGRYTATVARVQTAAGSYDPASSSQDVTVASGNTPSAMTIEYGEARASIGVDVAGLPANADAAITLVDPTSVSTAVMRSARTVGNAGRWRVNAAVVRTAGHRYVPSPAQADSSVLPGDSLRFAVRYALSTGAIAVAVTGVPDGTTPAVSITGPNGFAQSVSGTATLTDLAPGSYTVSAPAVSVNGTSYRATPESRTVSVEASLVATPATFTYAQVTSALVISVSGAPGGAADMVRVTGPAGFERVLSATTTLSGLVPGSYTVTASDITQPAATWRATPSTVTRTIAGDARDSVAIDYAIATGSIAVLATGLPDGVAGSMRVTGANDYAVTITGTTTLTRLVPGVYALEASNITSGGVTYVASPAQQQITVAASLVASPATVAYGAQNATLVISIAGQPQGTFPVTITGPSGFTRTIGATTTLTNLGAGTYTVTASSLTVAGTQYTPSPASSQRLLAAGGRDSVGIQYSASAPSTASITINVNGLPASVSSAITLSGPSTNRSITGSTTVSSLAPGSYTVTASGVTSSGTTYNPTPASQTLTVSAGSNGSATVTYTGAAAPTSDDLSVEYAYLTQAVQRTDGSVTLVANRAALLRVFVKNNRANTLKPDVRVRVYNGATLVRTITIAAPENSVRTSLDEGTLVSTWNTTLSAVDVTGALRISADVDPANGVSESDEGNNIWPAGGAPRSVSVTTVPNFTVRFVPVTVGALTGNVTPTNVSQYLRQTRLLMPLETIVHDIRLPFVSSAAELQSNDANSAWLTVLSEMNALRGADGAPSTMHYYGVVKVGYTSGVAGYGYVPGRAAIGWDHMPSGDGVAAHEWGHNFGRPHSPCGVFGDAAYPYSNGAVGQYGWNSMTNAIVLPTATDFMGYCNNSWTSDWTWQQVLSARTSAGIEMASMASGASRDGLLVWGRIVNGRVLLEPAFRVASPVTAPVRGSTFHVEALDVNGRTLLDLPIDAPKVDHVTSHEERQFAVVVPWTASLETSLASLRVRDVRTPLSVATRTSETARRVRTTQPSSVRIDAAQAEPQITVERSASRDRLRWNSMAFPLAVVRDAATGQTLAFARRSGDAFVSRGRAVDVTYSDGVRSVTRRIEAGAGR